MRFKNREKADKERSPELEKRIERYKPYWTSPDIAEKLNKGSKREHVQIGTKTYPIDVVDVEAEDTAESVDNVPVLWIPGYRGTSLTFASNMARLSKKGRRTISIYSPHGVPVPKENESEYKNIAQMRQAVAIVETLKQMNVDKVDVVAHSQGAIIVALAAMIEPSLFRSIVISSPAGMSGDESITSLLRRAMLESKDEKRRTSEESYPHKEKFAQLNNIRSKEGSDYLFANPAAFYHSFRELSSMASFKIDEMLRYLQEEEGIPIGFIHGEKDKLMLLEKIQLYVRDKAGIKEENIHIMQNAGHTLHAEYPDEFTDIAYDMLQNLKKQSEKTGE